MCRILHFLSAFFFGAQVKIDMDRAVVKSITFLKKLASCEFVCGTYRYRQSSRYIDIKIPAHINQTHYDSSSLKEKDSSFSQSNSFTYPNSTQKRIGSNAQTTIACASTEAFALGIKTSSAM